jgi:hypothetical protein
MLVNRKVSSSEIGANDSDTLDYVGPRLPKQKV